MSWLKSFGVIFGGMVLLLLGDFASKSGAIDPTVFRLTGAALMGLGVYLGLAASGIASDADAGGAGGAGRSRKR